MKKIMEVVSYVMLGVMIVSVIVFTSPWIPVDGGLWSPLDVVKDKMDDVYVGSIETPAEMPAEVPGEITAEISTESEFTELEVHTGPWSPDETERENLPLRKEISTMEQVTEYFDSRFPELWHSAHMTDWIVDYWWMDDGYNIVNRQPDETVGRSCVVNAATYLLSDDMEIYTVAGFRHNEQGGMPMLAINCIKTEDGYEFIDPVKGMQGDLGSRFGAILPEAKVSSVEEYVDLITSDPEIFGTLDYLYMFAGGERFEFYEDEQGFYNLRYPDVKSVYQNLDKGMAAAQLEAKAHIKPENIDRYQLSQMLGGTTLTPEQAYDLVYAKPEEVKEAVKTAGDLLMYMLAAQIGDCGGCYCDQWGQYVWHSNFTAKEVMAKKLANCGASANLANFLLEGDYEEVGIIQHAYYRGNGGGHVYNYFLHEGKYYIVDYSWYIFGNYAPSNDFPVLVLDSLEEYDGELANQLYSNVSLVIALTSTGQHLPNIFGEDYNEDPYHYYVPEGAEYTVLYEAGDGYLIAEKPLDKKYHDWTVYWPGYEAP